MDRRGGLRRARGESARGACSLAFLDRGQGDGSILHAEVGEGHHGGGSGLRIDLRNGCRRRLRQFGAGHGHRSRGTGQDVQLHLGQWRSSDLDIGEIDLLVGSLERWFDMGGCGRCGLGGDDSLDDGLARRPNEELWNGDVLGFGELRGQVGLNQGLARGRRLHPLLEDGRTRLGAIGSRELAGHHAQSSIVAGGRGLRMLLRRLEIEMADHIPLMDVVVDGWNVQNAERDDSRHRGVNQGRCQKRNGTTAGIRVDGEERNGGGRVHERMAPLLTHTPLSTILTAYRIAQRELLCHGVTSILTRSGNALIEGRAIASEAIHSGPRSHFSGSSHVYKPLERAKADVT